MIKIERCWKYHGDGDSSAEYTAPAMMTSTLSSSFAVNDNKGRILLLARDVSIFLTKDSMICFSVIFLMYSTPFNILLFRLQVLGFLLFWQVNDIRLIFKIVHVENVKMKLPSCLYMVSSQIYTYIHISLDPLSRSATEAHQTWGQTGNELKANLF